MKNIMMLALVFTMVGLSGCSIIGPGERGVGRVDDGAL